MKIYHEKLSQKVKTYEPGTPPSKGSSLCSAQTSLPLVKYSSVSVQALTLFRLLERLSRRTGYACVKLLETLAGMLEKSVRAVRYALAELLATGWLDRTQTRKGGKSRLFFRPLVRVAARSRGPFLGDPVAVCFAGYSPSKLQDAPSTHSKTAPVGTRDDNKQRGAGESPEPCPVAVSILKEVCPDSEALELAREASRHKLTEDQVRRTVAAYKGQVKNILNRGAWLRSALRRGFSPALSPSPHTSDQGGLPVAKKVTFTKEQLFGSQSKNTPAVQTAKAPVASHKAILGTPGAMPDLGRIQARIESLKTRTA